MTELIINCSLRSFTAFCTHLQHGRFYTGVERELECSICQDRLKQPATLPCQHTFCKDCIQRFSDESGNGRTFKCPICRQDLEVPDGNDFGIFSVSFLCSNLMEVFAAIPRESHPFCEERTHENEALDYYCKTCDRLICRACIALPLHRAHEIATVKEAGAEQKNILFHQKARLEQRTTEMQKALQELEEAEKQLHLFSKTAKEEVDQVAEELIALVQQHRRDAMLKIDQEEEEGANKFENGKHKINNLIRQLTDLCEHANNVIDGLKSHDILQVKNSLRDRSEHLLNCVIAKVEVNPFICFRSRDIKETFCKEGLGHVFRATAFLSSPTNVGPFNALSTVNLIVKATVPGLSEIIKIEVEPEPEQNGGGVDAEFTPKVPGEFTITARLGGKHIGNSPIKIRVEPQLMKITGKLIVKDGELKRPWSISVNSDCTLVAIADSLDSCVYIVDMEGEVKRRITGTRNNKLAGPTGVAFMVKADEIVVVDGDNSSIRVFNHKTGKQVWSKDFDCRNPTFDNFHLLYVLFDVHVDKTGDVIACSSNAAENSCIMVCDTRGNVKETFYTNELIGIPCRLGCIITSGNLWITSDWLNNCIHVINVRDKSKRWRIGREGQEDGEFFGPSGLAIDIDGNLLVCDYVISRIQKFTLEGTFIGKTCTKIERPRGIAALQDGRVMVATTEDKDLLIIV